MSVPPTQVASAPKVRNNRVQNLGDLDEDMQYRLPATEDREVDLSLLTAFLCSSEQVGAEKGKQRADEAETSMGGASLGMLAMGDAEGKGCRGEGMPRGRDAERKGCRGEGMPRRRC
eukprot:219851-Chlamydomonas_euryale.AAC.1